MNLLVFGHVSFVAEVVKIPCICLRVKLWDEWSTLGSECSPVNLSKVLMRINIFDVCKALVLRCNAAIKVSNV